MSRAGRARWVGLVTDAVYRVVMPPPGAGRHESSRVPRGCCETPCCTTDSSLRTKRLGEILWRVRPG